VPSSQRLLIASESAASAADLRALIGDPRGVSVETRAFDRARPDPLEGLASRPALLLLDAGSRTRAALEALAAYPPAERPALIVVGDVKDGECVRAAMRCGARDFLMEPVSPQELVSSIERVAAEHAPHGDGNDQGVITAFVNAKGGSGATFLACNTAHLFATVSNLKTVLVDLDLQFGAMPGYLDIEPKRSLLEALDVAADLDSAAIEAYLTRHASGLAVLAGQRDSAMLQQELVTDKFDAVLQLLGTNFDRLVVDVPRRIEPFGALVLERADRIVLVVQQSVPSLHDATRLCDLMKRYLSIAPERIGLVVNRYHKAASIEIADIERALESRVLVCIPNDYRAVTESVNMGLPIHEHARRSSVTKALLQLEKRLGGGAAADTSQSLITRLRRFG
jgi:pilus assembly protein CpaE